MQAVLSLCHCLQSVLDTTDLVPKQSLALQRRLKAAGAPACPRCRGLWRVPALRVPPVACTEAQPKADGHVSPELLEFSSCSCTRIVCPHVPVCSRCVCHRSICHPGRDCGVRVETEHLISLCGGSLRLSKFVNTSLLWCRPKLNHHVTIHKKNQILSLQHMRYFLNLES